MFERVVFVKDRVVNLWELGESGRESVFEEPDAFGCNGDVRWGEVGGLIKWGEVLLCQLHGSWHMGQGDWWKLVC